MLPSATAMLQDFIQAFNLGRGVLVADARSLLEHLIVIEIAVAGIVWAVNGSNIVAELLKKTFVIAIFVFTINHYDSVLSTVLDGFIATGERAASGSARTIVSVKDPDRIFMAAIHALTPVVNQLKKFSILNLGTDILMLMLTMNLILLCFIILGAQMFITYIEFHITTTLAIIFLPFGVFRRTAFMAEKVFTLMIAFGVRLMMLAFILSVAVPVIEGVALPERSTWQSSFHLLFVSMTLTALALHAPGIAAGLLVGTPSISAGDFKRLGLKAISLGATTATATGVATLGGVAGATRPAQGGSVATLKSAASGSASMGGSTTPLAGNGGAGNLFSSLRATPSWRRGEMVGTAARDLFRGGRNMIVGAYRTATITKTQNEEPESRSAGSQTPDNGETLKEYGKDDSATLALVAEESAHYDRFKLASRAEKGATAEDNVAPKEAVRGQEAPITGPQPQKEQLLKSLPRKKKGDDDAQ